MADDQPHIPTARRFYLLLRRNAWDEGIAAVWRAKQEAQPGTVLPDPFPARASLAAAGYTTVEDLAGATEDELINAGLSTHEARTALKAISTL